MNPVIAWVCWTGAAASAGIFGFAFGYHRCALDNEKFHQEHIRALRRVIDELHHELDTEHRKVLAYEETARAILNKKEQEESP